MLLTELLAAIEADGRVLVAADFDADPTGLDARLRELDAAVRADGPRDLPALDLEAATWATGRLHAVCVLLVHRQFGAEVVARECTVPCPAPAAATPAARAAQHYSVDLTLRHLPDALRLCRLLAPADPLRDAIHTLLRDWPLSAVGVPDLGPVDPGPLLADPGLRRLYVDRILSRDDVDAALHEAVRPTVLGAIGEVHQPIAPRIQRALATSNDTP